MKLSSAPNRIVSLSGAAALGACLLLAPEANSAGFALQEHSVPGLGNAFAGGAAVAEDASTVYFNPAGMVLIDQPQVVVGAHLVLTEAEFRDQGSTTLGVPTQGSDSTSDEKALLPNLFWATPWTEDLVFGLGLSVPFGLATEYEADWVGRYIARRTELETVMLNPSLAYRLTDKLSLGGGFSYVDAKATLTNAVDFGLVFLNQLQSGAIPANQQTAALAADIQANLGGTKYDGSLDLEGDGDGWGYNVGLLYEFNDSWRAGLHYRSEVSVGLNGWADFEIGLLEAPLGTAFQDQGGFVDIDLPDTVSLSIYGAVTERLALMADVTRTWWSDFDYLVIQFENPSPSDSVVPELWRNVNKYSVGANYRLTGALTGRIGLAYDESPVPGNAYRSPRIPDADRRWLSLGLSWRASEALDLHLSYLRVFVDDPVIDNPTHSIGHRLRGRIDAQVDVVSLGATWRY